MDKNRYGLDDKHNILVNYNVLLVVQVFNIGIIQKNHCSDVM